MKFIKRLIVSSLPLCALLCTAAMSLLSGCENPMDDHGPDAGSPTTFTATIEGGDGTKTALGTPDASGVRAVKWSDDDAISISGATYTVSSGAETATATFTGSGAQLDGGKYKAYYPASVYNGGTPSLPAVQDYEVAGRIDHLPMYAEDATTTLNFKNLCAVLEFKLTGTKTVGSIGLKSTEGKKLSGAFTPQNWASDSRSVEMDASASDSVTLSCGASGVALDATTPVSFFIAVPAQSYTSGTLRVTVKDLSGNEITSFTNSRANLEVVRSTIYEISKNTKPKYLPGLFSVSPTEKVRFSSGNLLVKNTLRNDVNEREWMFEENQWEISHTCNSDPSVTAETNTYYSKEGETYNISYFGWATAGRARAGQNYAYDPCQIRFYPHITEADAIIYSVSYPYNGDGYGPAITGPHEWAGLIPQYLNWIAEQVKHNTWNAQIAGGVSPSNEVRSYCDWGIHFDEAGNGFDDKYDGLWFTLSIYQWEYLLGINNQVGMRLNATQLRDLGRIYDNRTNTYVNGLIILPDDWILPATCLPFQTPVTSSYERNTYAAYGNTNATSGRWEDMEAAGAVFLPANGIRRDGIYIYFAGSNCQYWSSSSKATGGGIYMHSQSTTPYIGTIARDAVSVRLVHYDASTSSPAHGGSTSSYTQGGNSGF